MAEDIARDVAAFNATINITTDKNHKELTQRFIDLVQTHTDAKEYGIDFQ